MQHELIKQNNDELKVKESWAKPELTLIGIKEETLGAFSTHGSDGTFSS